MATLYLLSARVLLHSLALAECSTTTAMPLQYQPLSRLQDSDGHLDAITALAFSPNGMLLASGGLDGRVCIWDVCSHKLRYVFSGKSSILSLIWLCPSNEHLVCGMEDGTIASLTVSPILITLTGFWAHRYPVERLALSGTTLASGAHKEVKVWLRRHDGIWTQARMLDPPPQSSYTLGCDVIVTSLHWTSAAQLPSVLLITYMSHGIVAYDAQNWERIRATPFPGQIADASLTQDGRLLVVSNLLTGFELFLMKSPAEVEPLFCFKQDVSVGRPLPVRFLHGDHAIIGGTSHGQVNMWDVYTRLKQSLGVPSAQASVLAVAAHYNSVGDKFLVATGTFAIGAASPIIIWQAREAHNRRNLTGTLDSYSTLELSYSMLHSRMPQWIIVLLLAFVAALIIFRQ